MGSRAFYEARELAFGEQVRDEDFAHWERLFEAGSRDRSVRRDRVVGTAGIFSFQATIPGGMLPRGGRDDRWRPSNPPSPGASCGG